MRGLLFYLTLFTACLTMALYADATLTFVGVAEPTARGAGRALLQTLAWIAGAFAAISAINRFFWDGMVARIARRPVPDLLKSALALIILLLAVTGILSVVFHFDVTGIWATSGVIGIVLGLALRSMIQDAFTGIALNLDGAIQAGDWVKLHHRDFVGAGPLYGRVLEITWRTSRIELETNDVVVVPNSMMGTMAVTNFGHGGHVSRLEIEVVLDFDVPPERARRILLAGARMASAQGRVLEQPPPAVVVGAPIDRGVVYKVRFWARLSESAPGVLVDAVMSSVLAQLRVAGLTPAYPKEDVFYARLPKRLLQHDRVEDRVEVLSRVELFGRTMSQAELSELAASVTPATYEPGDVLVHEGDPGDSLFVVVEGVVDVLAHLPDSPRELRLGHLRSGEIFGEMALLTGERRSASVVAGTGVMVYEIKRQHFESILAGRPEIADQISGLVAARRLRTDEAMSSASAAEFETESRRLKGQILERMKSVFVMILGSPDQQHVRHSRSA